MSNTNRDYLIVCEVKNSKITIARQLNFYTTDKNTSNIFIRLVNRIENDNGISSYIDIENATAYNVTLRIVKPNNETISVMATQLEPEAIYQVDLEENCKNIAGTYKCELLITTTVNGREELNTSDPFTYLVKNSILSKVGEIVESGGITTEKLLNDLNATKAELSSQIKDIANLSLVKHTDGKVYIKKQDGTLIGEGIEIGGSDVDLSKITMSIDGQTLKLLNDGTEISTVEIPTAVIDNEQINNAVNDYITNNGITFNFALKDADYNAYITTQKVVTNAPVIKGYKDYKTIAKGDTVEFSGALGRANSLVLIPITPITKATTEAIYFDNDYYIRPYIYNNSKIVSIIQTNYSLGTQTLDGTEICAYCLDTKARFYSNNTVLSTAYSTNYLQSNSYPITYLRNGTSTDYVAISYDKELTDDEFLQLSKQFGGEN